MWWRQQSKRKSENYKLEHISSGDLLRRESESDSDLSEKFKDYLKKGILFPDDLVNIIFLKHILMNNYILDGYLRKLSQVGKIKNINLIIYRDLNEEEVIKRILNRGEVREDDKLKAIKTRLDELKKNTFPVIEYYKKTGLMITIDGSKSPDNIFEEIDQILSNSNR